MGLLWLMVRSRPPMVPRCPRSHGAADVVRVAVAADIALRSAPLRRRARQKTTDLRMMRPVKPPRRLFFSPSNCPPNLKR